MGWAKYFEDNRIVVEERFDEMRSISTDVAWGNKRGLQEKVSKCTWVYPSNIGDYLVGNMNVAKYAGE